MIAAKSPPAETAPDIAVLDQSNSVTIGVMKIESVATAGPCLTNPAQQAQKRIIQP
jgi:hypothetical protein